MTGAVFDNTTLSGTSFTSSIMPNASFQSATLQSTKFSGAVLQGAKFNNARIQAPPQGGGSGADFSCSQLGGADFSNATIAASSFSDAVMPAKEACCPASSPNTPAFCGIVDATQLAYGPMTFPVLPVPTTCPNGDVAECAGQDWQLSPNWQTTGCNSNGVLQTMWSKPNCGGTPGNIVEFKDKNLKDCILATLPGQTEVLLATAQQVTQVVCPGRGINDIGGLENFISLTKLDLGSNALSIFTLMPRSGGNPVSSQLQTLTLDSNSLTTLDLTAHPNLIWLSAANNQLGGILLSANAYLLGLNASHNRLTSFNLPVQTSLTYADLSYNHLSNVLNQFSSSLTTLSALQYLDLSHNGLTTIGSIRSIAFNRKAETGNLQSLFLACNPSFHCGDLEVYDGSNFPAAQHSECSIYNSSTSDWVPTATPGCPPG